MDRILIVRLGSLGDIVHALPAVAALREAFPSARLDWLVDARHLDVLDLVPIVDRRIVWRSPGSSGWSEIWRTIAGLRAEGYNVALDLQGLLKSAVLARLSGARRVLGFSTRHLRERSARVFYTEAIAPDGATHVIEKNLAMARALGARTNQWCFPLQAPDSGLASVVRTSLDISRSDRFALMNPGAAWPNKRWPTDRFGGLAALLRDRHGLASAVLWGPGEEGLAREVAAASRGAAHVAPATTIADLVAVIRDAALMVSGDTGPIHIASALGTPVVGIYGPTDPRRNGPWSPDDVCVSRSSECLCYHKRRCRQRTWCVGEITVDEVFAASERRLSGLTTHA